MARFFYTRAKYPCACDSLRPTPRHHHLVLWMSRTRRRRTRARRREKGRQVDHTLMTTRGVSSIQSRSDHVNNPLARFGNLPITSVDLDPPWTSMSLALHASVHLRPVLRAPIILRLLEICVRTFCACGHRIRFAARRHSLRREARYQPRV